MRNAIKNIRLLQIVVFAVLVYTQPAFSQHRIQDTILSASPDSISVNNASDSVRDTVEEHFFFIRNIIIEGNKKTREKIILRELVFKIGDSIRISDIPQNFQEAQDRLINTGLFHDTHLSVSAFTRDSVDIKVTVVERWYLLPLLYFKPVDRNLSQWLFEEKARLDRIDYGAKILWGNVTGNNDKLRLYFVTGYTQQLLLWYQRPFIDKNMKWGFSSSVSAGKSHQINYLTKDNKQVFLELHGKDFARNFFTANVEASYRPAYYTTHFFGFAYNTLSVHDSVLKLNPNFFRIPGNTIRYPDFYYKLLHRNFDYNPYPTRGHAAELTLQRQGINKDINVTQLTAKGIKYWQINPKAFYSIGVTGSVKVPFKQPYFSSQLLGYGDFYLNGYEYYVIDGSAGGIVTTTLSQQLTQFKIHLPIIRKVAPSLVPFKIYGKVLGNVGYGYQKNPVADKLSNKPVFGGGFGLDIVTLYDFALKIEWSFNQLGQNGIYLQKKTTFQ
jgi:hypothetical protein